MTAALRPNGIAYRGPYKVWQLHPHAPWLVTHRPSGKLLSTHDGDNARALAIAEAERLAADEKQRWSEVP